MEYKIVKLSRKKIIEIGVLNDFRNGVQLKTLRAKGTINKVFEVHLLNSCRENSVIKNLEVCLNILNLAYQGDFSFADM